MIVPIYNVVSYLEECINSIFSQTFSELEIILVDDGSTDGSGALADILAAKDDRAKVVHKKNGGLSDARNAGLKIAHGTFVTFIDSDDYVDRNFIQQAVDVALTTGAQIVQVANTRKPSKLGEGSVGVRVCDGGRAFLDMMRFKSVSPTAWGKVYRTSLFKDNNLEFPTGRIHEDTAILYKLVFYANLIASIKRKMYYYRINRDSIMTASYTPAHYNSVVKYHAELEEFIDKNAIEIDAATIARHKALRILSVLNKMSLAQMEQSAQYEKFRSEYVALTKSSRSLICFMGIAPAAMPALFKSMRAAVRYLRPLVGAV